VASSAAEAAEAAGPETAPVAPVPEPTPAVSDEGTRHG